ncbi:MAG: hypothetical protein Q9207_000837 [Kuettlingeria erythrocarpa]
MGSRGLDADNAKEEVTVLVTGFGENLPDIKVISATPIPVQYSVVRDVVPRLDFPQAPPQATATVPLTPQTDTPPSQDLLPADPLTDRHPRFDYILHIGMAAPRKYYTMETCAHRDGYVAKDDAGETLEGDTYWRDEYKSPEVLRPGFDVDDVWRRWKSELMV